MLAPHPGGKGPLPKHTPVLVESMRSLGCEVTAEGWGYRSERESLLSKVRDRTQDVARIRRLAGRGRYDMLVIKTGHDWRTLSRDIPLLLATRGRVHKQVVQFQGSKSHLLFEKGNLAFKAASRTLTRLCDAVLVLSKEEQTEWKRFSGSEHVYVVANPLVPGSDGAAATEHLHPGLGAIPDGPIILFVGRLVREKGTYELLEAARLLHRDDPALPWSLVLAGDGPEADGLRQKSREDGLDGRVFFAGYLQQGPLEALYRRSALLVLPSYAEGFPTVITEAMAAGVPVVTTFIRGVADHLEEGTNALFVPPKQVGPLRDALEVLLRDGALRESMGRANREKVKVFSPEAVGRQYVSTLQAIVAADR